MTRSNDRDRNSLGRGFVIHTRPWRNTSLLLEVLTLDAGRIGLIARGARGKNARTRAPLEPFQPLLLAWSGRGDLHTLTSVEPERRYPALTGRTLVSGFYCNELIMRLLVREAPEPTIFDAYDRVLAALAGEAETEPALRRFELELLDALGFAPPLALDATHGEPVAAERDYDFIVEYGPVPAVGASKPEAVRVSGAHLLALADLDFSDPALLRPARQLLRASLAPHLGARPLKSRELYRSMYGGR